MFELAGNNREVNGKSGSTGLITGNNGKDLNENLSGYPDILAALSREMRTQMNAVVSFAFLLGKDEYKETEKNEFSNQIFDSCETIINLFDNFLDSTIIDTGNSKSEPGNFKPEYVFNSLFSEFREVLKKEKHNELTLVVESQSISSDEYLIDTNKLTKVIRNLFQNALYNTKAGYITIGYYFSADKLNFYILDSGQGYEKCREYLNSTDISASFSRFSDIYTAINLGLTKRLVKMMNGSIRIECNGLTGTAIHFSVPSPTVVKVDKNSNRKANTIFTI